LQAYRGILLHVALEHRGAQKMSRPSVSFSMWTLSRPLDSDNAVRDALRPSSMNAVALLEAIAKRDYLLKQSLLRGVLPF
jgi:hypothetical protein